MTKWIRRAAIVAAAAAWLWYEATHGWPLPYVPSVD